MVSIGAAPGQPVGMRVVGGLASLGALAGVAAAATGEATAAAPDQPVFFGRHLFAVPIEVPPGLFVKRFIVVNTPGDPGLGCLSRLTMSYQLADKTTHRVTVGFRSGDTSRGVSRWQANACPRSEW
jgi:hypothetical protein